jgi:hypothetical protein
VRQQVSFKNDPEIHRLVNGTRSDREPEPGFCPALHRPPPRYIDNGLGELVRSLTRLGSLERLFGLDREAEGNFRRTVENLQDMIAEQAPVLALGAAYGIQFNAAVAGIAFGTGDVGPSHPGYMPPIVGRCKPVAPSQGSVFGGPDQTLKYTFV